MRLRAYMFAVFASNRVELCSPSSRSDLVAKIVVGQTTELYNSIIYMGEVWFIRANCFGLGPLNDWDTSSPASSSKRDCSLYKRRNLPEVHDSAHSCYMPTNFLKLYWETGCSQRNAHRRWLEWRANGLYLFGVVCRRHSDALIDAELQYKY